jgi:transcription termination factor NusB
MLVVESLARIQASLRGLSRRERRNLLLQAGLGAVAAWCLAWALVAAAVNAELATQRVGSAWIGAMLVAGLVAGAWPLRRWRDATNARRQAERIEALRPDLAGALLTVLDRAARPQGSPGLLARIAARSAGVVEAVPPAAVHPSRPLVRLAGLTLASAVLLGLAGLLLPRGPLEALAALRTPPVVKPEAEVPVPEGPHALVGDITLRYLYPTYTGREPLEVPNSNGEVHAPPGTRVEVRARTGETYKSAALVVYEGAPEPIEITDGRGLRGAFTVTTPGVWRFVFGDLPSPDYHIVPEPDLPPDVAVKGPPGVQTLAADDPLQAIWNARDDFGLVRVVVEVDEGNRKREVPVRTPVDVPRELAGDLPLTPAKLGLVAGTKARLRVAAWDNDAIAGSKPGYSSVIQVEVLGAHGRQDRQNHYRKLLRDALVQVLGDFLLDPAPPVATPADGAVWARTAVARYEHFDQLVQEAWGGAKSDSFDDTLLQVVHDKRRALVSFAGTLGDGPRLGERDAATFLGLQSANVDAIENAVLMLDEVLRTAALESIDELVKQVATEAADLQHDFSSLSKEGALARLDQLQRLYQQLAREAAKLDQGELQEFLNDRNASIQAMMDAIRKALAEGRIDDARELMDRLAAQMREMADQVHAMQDRRGEDGEKLAKAMEQVQQELGQLEADQQKLREKTEAARDKYGGDLDQAVDRWKEIEKLAATVVEKLGGIDGNLEPFHAPSWTGGSLLDETRADAGGLHDSARARDLQTALQRADQVAGEIHLLGSRASRPTKAPVDGLPAAQKVLAAEEKDVEHIRDLLEQMAQRQAQTSPALQQELQQMEGDQQQLSERAKQTAGRAGDLAENLPMDAPGLADGAKRGADQAARAAEAMGDGDAMSTEGGQRAAEDGFREAEDALQQAQRNLQQMQQAAKGEGSGKGDRKNGPDGGKESSGDGNDLLSGQMALPAPEAFKTPEEYRRALLDGMEGEVPEEYKALNRRYYEELVRQ